MSTKSTFDLLIELVNPKPKSTTAEPVQKRRTAAYFKGVFTPPPTVSGEQLTEMGLRTFQMVFGVAPEMSDDVNTCFWPVPEPEPLVPPRRIGVTLRLQNDVLDIIHAKVGLIEAMGSLRENIIIRTSPATLRAIAKIITPGGASHDAAANSYLRALDVVVKDDHYNNDIHIYDVENAYKDSRLHRVICVEVGVK